MFADGASIKTVSQNSLSNGEEDAVLSCTATGIIYVYRNNYSHFKINSEVYFEINMYICFL